MQCIIVKDSARCTNDSVESLVQGVTLPIVKPDAMVYICGVCIDEMHFVLHEREGIGEISDK